MENYREGFMENVIESQSNALDSPGTRRKSMDSQPGRPVLDSPSSPVPRSPRGSFEMQRPAATNRGVRLYLDPTLVGIEIHTCGDSLITHQWSF